MIILEVNGSGAGVSIGLFLLFLFGILWVIGIVKCFKARIWGLGVAAAILPIVGIILCFIKLGGIQEMKGAEIAAVRPEQRIKTVTKSVYTALPIISEIDPNLSHVVATRIGSLKLWLQDIKELENHLVEGRIAKEQLSPPPPYDEIKKWINQEIVRLRETAERKTILTYL